MSRFVVLASATLAAFAACTDPSDPVGPDDALPSIELPAAAAGPPLAHVRVHTVSPSVYFHDASGAVVATAHSIDGIATAEVPAGASATVPRLTGHIVIGGEPRILRVFEAASSVADGDDLTLGAVAIPGRAQVAVALPAAPAGTTAITAYWCSRSARADGEAITLERTACGDHRGALFVAGDPAPTAAFVVDDLGDGAALDLSARAWQPLVATEVTLSPAPSASRTWTVRTGAVVDGDVIPLGDELIADGATVRVPVFARGAVIATADDEPGESPTLDEITVVRADAAPFTIDLAATPFPALIARATGPRSFSIDGDLDPAARASLAISADLASPSSLDTWHVQLRGRDHEFAMPPLGDPTATLEQIELRLTDTRADRVWTRRQPFFVR